MHESLLYTLGSDASVLRTYAELNPGERVRETKRERERQRNRKREKERERGRNEVV